MSRCWRALFGMLVLASLCLAANGDSPRMKSLSAKVLCDCGCREVLGECSHKECKRKFGMQQEIATATGQGKSDKQVLEQIAVAHGSDILITPMFRGFNTLLWIVPVTIGVIAMGMTLAVQRKKAQHK